MRMTLIAAAGLLIAPYNPVLGCDPAASAFVCPTPVVAAAPITTVAPVFASPVMAGQGVVYAPAAVTALPVVSYPAAAAIALPPAQPFAHPQPLVQPLAIPHRAAVVAPGASGRVTIERRGLLRRERITVQ